MTVEGPSNSSWFCQSISHGYAKWNIPIFPFIQQRVLDFFEEWHQPEMAYGTAFFQSLHCFMGREHATTNLLSNDWKTSMKLDPFLECDTIIFQWYFRISLAFFHFTRTSFSNVLKLKVPREFTLMINKDYSLREIDYCVMWYIRLLVSW